MDHYSKINLSNMKTKSTPPVGKRKLIVDSINRKRNGIKKLQSEINKLYEKWLFLSDVTQQYKVTTEMIGGRKKTKAKVGRVHWKETFVDEDTGDPVVIERTQVVTIDGKFSDFIFNLP